MSDSLLQKSCKLLQESKHIKKTRKSQKLRLKKKKSCLDLKQLEDLDFQSNIIKNLQRLEHFNRKTSVEVSEKILAKCSKTCDQDTKAKEKEEGTVFTDKDFEEFEKEYFGD